MNLTLREMRVFKTVYEMRSFSAASVTVHMTQSAASKLCQEMEIKIGGRLFERSSRKVEPTLLADCLYGYACDILGTMDAASRSLRGLLNLEAGDITIATSPMMVYGLLLAPIEQFQREHPGVRFLIHELSTDQTIEFVLNGKADFGLASIRQEYPKLKIEPLYDEAMRAVCSSEHPLAGRANVSWEELATHPQVSLHASFSVRRLVDAIYAQKGLSYTAIAETGTVLSLLGLLRSGRSVSVLPGYLMQFVADLGLRSLALPATDFRHPISLVLRSNARPSASAQELITLLKTSIPRGHCH